MQIRLGWFFFLTQRLHCVPSSWFLLASRIITQENDDNKDDNEDDGNIDDDYDYQCVDDDKDDDEDVEVLKKSFVIKKLLFQTLFKWEVLISWVITH